MTTIAAQPPSDRIRLTGLSARGRHGVLPFEREEGQLFVVDVAMDVGTRGTAVAAVTDALEDAVDYSAVAAAVVEVVEGPPVNLLETLAERVSDAVLAFPRVEGVEITVHKPQAPLDVAFDDVSVTIVRDSAAARAVPVPAVPDAVSDEGPTASGDEYPGVASVAAAAAAAGLDDAPATGLDVSDEDVAAPAEPGAVLAPAEPGAVPALAEPGAVLTPPTGEVPDTAQETPSAADEPPVAPTPDAPAGLRAETGQDAAEPAPVPAAAPPAPEPPAPVDLLAQRPTQPVGFVIALGGNVGGVVPALRKAVQTLEDTTGIEVTDLAPLARTAAVVAEGRPAQPDYLNTVVVGLTALSPRELLEVCRALEADAGRVRTESQGPRTLDADLVTVEGITSTDPELTLPHPRAAERAFVLVPWAQADPFAELDGRSVADLAEAAPDREGVRWLALDWLTSDRLPALPTGQYVAPPDAPEAAEPPAGETAEKASDAGEDPSQDPADVVDQAPAAPEPPAPEDPGTPAAADVAPAADPAESEEGAWAAPPAWDDVVGGEGAGGAGIWPGHENREA